MQWVDHETYVGPCRRIAQRPHLMHRRRMNRAQPGPPDLRLLLAQVGLAVRLGGDVANRPQTRMRVDAALDLADRLGDGRMLAAFQAFRSTALSVDDGRPVQ